MRCLDGAKLKSICRTVQVLPECLRLRKVPAVHCNIAKTKGQPEIQNSDHSPYEWASGLTADPRKRLTIHVRRLCCSRALQTVQQRVPLVSHQCNSLQCSPVPWLRPATTYSPKRIRSKCQRDQAKEQPSRVTDTNELRDEPTPNGQRGRGEVQSGGCVCIVRVNSHQPSLVTSVLCE